MRVALLLASLAAAAVTCAAAGTVYAQQAKLKPEAQAHLDAALKAYAAKDFDVAFREFDEAFAIDPNPALLYAKAQSLRHADKCAQAIEVYKRFLAAATTDEQIQAGKSGVALCDEILDKAATTVKPPPADTKPSPAKPVEPPPAPVQPPPPAATPPDQTPPPSIPAPHDTAWYKDPLADGLVIGGVIGIGVGIAFFAKGSASESAAHSAEFRDDFLRHLDDATSQRRIGAVAVTAGAALAIGGVVVFVRHRHHEPKLVGATDGHSLFVAGSF